MPATPTPMPTRASSSVAVGSARQGPPRRRRSRRPSRASRGRSDPDELVDRFPRSRPVRPPGSPRLISRARTTPRPGRHGRAARAARHPCRLVARLDQHATGDELADEGAHRPACQTRVGHELGPRQRARRAPARDPAQVRAPHGLAALADDVRERPHEDLCSSLSNVDVDSFIATSHVNTDSRRRAMRWTDATRCAGESSRRRPSGASKVIPAIHRGRALRGRRDRLPRRRAGRAASRPSSASPGPTGPTRRCSPTPRWRRSTSRSRTTSTPSGRSPRGAGKHVLCEKPLALTAAEADA